jgi:hypothetical protein
MTTKRQIKTLLAPLLARHPDVAQVENSFGLQFVLKPLGHINRGFMVWPTGDADRPHYHWYLGYTFSPENGPYGPFVFDFYTREAETMAWSHPRHREALIEALETDILPQLRSVDSIERILSFPPANHFRWKGWLQHPKHLLRFRIALGQFDAAEAIVEAIRDGTADIHPGWSPAIQAELLGELWPLVETRNLIALAALLHDWERQFVELNGMRDIYEKMPFPFEQAAST